MDEASSRGDLDRVKYLHEVVKALCTANAMDWAASGGHRETVKYLHEVVGAPCTTDAMDLAASGGHRETVRYLHEVVGAPCTHWAMDWATQKGHLEMVKYLHEVVNAPCTYRAMAGAAENGHFVVVAYLYEVVRAPYTKDGFQLGMIAYRGHLKVVEYMHGVMGDPITRYTLERANMGGHPDVLKYMLEAVKESPLSVAMTCEAYLEAETLFLHDKLKKLGKETCCGDPPDLYRMRDFFKTAGEFNDILPHIELTGDPGAGKSKVSQIVAGLDLPHA